MRLFSISVLGLILLGCTAIPRSSIHGTAADERRVAVQSDHQTTPAGHGRRSASRRDASVQAVSLMIGNSSVGLTSMLASIW